MRNFAFLLLLSLAGCGYKPLAYYANRAFGKSIYVEIIIRPDFPKAGVSAKDLINRAILSRLHLELASKESAESILRVNIDKINFEMIAEDSQGFANHYRAKVDVSFSYKNLEGQEYEINLNASSDYAATSAMSSLAIEKAQFNAINLALQQIVDQFTSRIFYQGVIPERQ